MNPRRLDKLKRDKALHPVQYIFQVPYVMSLGFTPMTAFGFGGFLSRPYKEALELISPAMNVQWGNGTYHLVSHEAPFDYLRKAGKGWAILGFGIELTKFAAASVPAGLIGYGFGQTLVHFGDVIAESSSPSLRAIQFILQTPVVREPIITVVSLLSYMGSKALIERFFTSPDIPREDDPDLNVVQRLVPLLSMRTYNVIAYTETLRQILLAANAEGVLRHRDFNVLGAVIDQLLQFTMYAAFVPRPFDSLVPRDKWTMMRRDEYEPVALEEGDIIETEIAPPVEARNSAIVWYSVRTATALTMAYLVNLLISAFQEDKEKLSNIERFACMAAVYFVSMMVEQLFESSPRIAQSASRCWAGMFSGNKAVPVSSVVVEEVSEPPKPAQ